MVVRRLAFALLLIILARDAGASGFLDLSGHRLDLVAEGGVLWTPTMDIHGYRQSNATRNWNTVAPTVRLEAWLTRPDALAIGIVLQPQFLSYEDTIRNPLTYRGRNFRAGEPGKLDYRYNSARLTANYDVWAGEATELRIGASLLFRYAEVELSSPSARFTRTDFVVAPLLNLAASTRLTEGFSLVARADLFPAARNAGFYDIFAGLRADLDGGRAIEFGSRTFFGGYLPEKENDFGNRVVFQGIVGRFVF